MAQRPTIQLTEPIEVDGKPLTEVTLSPLKTKGLREIAKAPEGIEGTIVMVRHVTGLTDEQIDELVAVDFTKIAEAAADFLPQEDLPATT